MGPGGLRADIRLHSSATTLCADNGHGPTSLDHLVSADWSSSDSIAGVADTVLVNAPTFEGWYLLQGKAGAISRTTDTYALLPGGLSRREGGRAAIGVARIECSRTQWQERYEEYGDDGERWPVTFHGSAP